MASIIATHYHVVTDTLKYDIVTVENKMESINLKSS